MRLRILLIAAVLAISPAAANDAPLTEQVEDLYERSSDEHRFHMTCLNGTRELRKWTRKTWVDQLKRSMDLLAERPELFDKKFLTTIRSNAIANAKPDDDMTLAEQRKICDADKDWRRRLHLLQIVLLWKETKKILDGD